MHEAYRTSALGAIRALLHLITSLEIQSLDALVDAFTARAVLDPDGFGTDESLSPLGRAVRRFVGRQLRQPPLDHESVFASLDHLDEEQQAEILCSADGFIAPELASSLADRLEETDLLPDFARLPALLAARDPERCDRLVHRFAKTTGETNEVWINTVIEAFLAAGDAGVQIPDVVAAAWSAIQAADPFDIGPEAWYAAQLRVAARRDPIRALDSLMDAIDQVGDTELAEGLTSVVVRAAAVDREAVWRRLKDGMLPPSTGALNLRDLCFDGTFGVRERDYGEQLIKGLSHPVDPRDVWAAALSLLGLAANIGEPDLAVRIADKINLAPWEVYVATWPAARRRALRTTSWDTSFWTQLLRAVERSGQEDEAASAVFLAFSPLAQLSSEALSVLWAVKTLPLKRLPWWTAWSGRVP